MNALEISGLSNPPNMTQSLNLEGKLIRSGCKKKDAIITQKTHDILNNPRDISPLRVANIDIQDACELVVRIHNNFHNKLTEYENEGLLACEEDNKKLEELKKDWRINKKLGYTTLGGAAGIGIAAGTLFLLSISGGGVPLIIGGLSGGICGLYKEKGDGEEELEVNSCINKVDWINSIISSEEARNIENKDLLIKRAKELVSKQLLEEKELGEFRQIEEFFNAIFSKDGTNLSTELAINEGFENKEELRELSLRLNKTLSSSLEINMGECLEKVLSTKKPNDRSLGRKNIWLTKQIEDRFKVLHPGKNIFVEIIIRKVISSLLEDKPDYLIQEEVRPILEGISSFCESESALKAKAHECIQVILDCQNLTESNKKELLDIYKSFLSLYPLEDIFINFILNKYINLIEDQTEERCISNILIGVFEKLSEVMEGNVLEKNLIRAIEYLMSSTKNKKKIKDLVNCFELVYKNRSAIVDLLVGKLESSLDDENKELKELAHQSDIIFEEKKILLKK